MRPDRDWLQFDCALSYGLCEYQRTLAMLKDAGWSWRRCIPHGGHQMSLAIAAGLGLGGNESYPDVFQPYGGFPDGTRVENGIVTLPDLPGIGFEAKSDLYRDHARAGGVERTNHHMPVPLRIGIAGVGHFGRYHALKVAASERAALAGVFDPDAERARTVGWEAGAPALDFPALLAASDALVIAAPAEAHHALAVEALRAGKHVLVEKPIAATLAQADELAALAAERNLVLQVGHLERFSAAFAAMEGRLGAPLYIEATRIAPFKQRGTDVSVILDLMIHDLDLILSLVASEIDSVDAVGAAVASEHADMANARIRFANGAVATITASRVAMRTERRMRVFAQDGYLAVDFANRRLTVIARGRGTPVPGVADFGIEEASWQDHDSLAAEHAAFVASVLDGAPVLVDAAAGRRALAAALMVTDGIAAARARMVASGLIEQVENDSGGGV